MCKQDHSGQPSIHQPAPLPPLLSVAAAAETLRSMPRLRILLVGDACLDVYWHADMRLSQLSRETPNFPLPIVDERFSPGGGANAAACLRALGVGEVLLLTAMGEDWRARELEQACIRSGIDTSAVVTSQRVVTPAYCKPVRRGISDVAYEDQRIDFENRDPLPAEIETELIGRLRELAGSVDAIAVSDQLEYGVVTPELRNALLSLSRDGLIVVADSRSRIGLFKGVITKPNEYECAVALSTQPDSHEFPNPVSTDPGQPGGSDRQLLAQELSRRNGAPVCMTLGSDGAVWATADESTAVPAVKVTPPVDTVGAGDCFLSALTGSLAVGRSGVEAAFLANLASAVTVKKLGTTGTATPDEILSLLQKMDTERTPRKC